MAVDGKWSELEQLMTSAFANIAGNPQWGAERSCIILSGGLDTSVVAEAGGEALGLKKAFTVFASKDATDRGHAEAVAAAAKLEHHIIETDLPSILEELPWVVRVLRSFDPMSLRNSIAVARALREAKEAGCSCAVTGDGADELFGGYSFTHRLDDDAWMSQRAHMVAQMHFDSIQLGEHLGIFVASPFLNPRVVAFALDCTKAECVAEREGQLLGKMPLRHAFPNVVSRWRRKDPIEVGCGSTELGDRPWLGKKGFFDAQLSDSEFEAEAARALTEEGVHIRDKEHLHYYRVFQEVFPGGVVPGKPRSQPPFCPRCLYHLRDASATFCTTCGHYDREMPAQLAAQTCCD